MGKSEERRPPESGREPGENTAVAGLIMGIAAVVFWFFGYSAVASVVLGILGLIWTDKAKKEGYTGDKRTIAFVLSLVGPYRRAGCAYRYGDPHQCAGSTGDNGLEGYAGNDKRNGK